MVSRVAEIIISRQSELGVSNAKLALACGYENFNVIAMMRKGRTKFPLEKIGLIANALQLDPVWLLRVAMSEYSPGKLTAIESIVGPLVTKNELQLLERWRQATHGEDPELSEPVKRGMLEVVKLAKGTAQDRS
ncbi:hypothetical protein [uncultured Halomonas sp.]|uniref:hypothetical protein n=1 Tax=uncultured Halomonas sp. TaxID=173971 RepID=UPI0026191442|nr:hypothetical protein [uncultured Halomonas sp.]